MNLTNSEINEAIANMVPNSTLGLIMKRKIPAGIVSKTTILANSFFPLVIQNLCSSNPISPTKRPELIMLIDDFRIGIYMDNKCIEINTARA